MLAGRSPEETLVPYQPFLEALRHYVVGVPSAQLRATAREYGAELARLVPELRRRAPELPAPTRDEPETERYRLFEAVVGLLDEISACAPVLLVLDDLQWADRPTLLLLRHLARAPEPARDADPRRLSRRPSTSEGFADALAELRRERLVVELDIGGLPEGETARARAASAAGGNAVAGVRHARCTARPRATRSSSRRSSATSSEAGVTLDRRRRPRAGAGRRFPRGSRT